MPEMLPEKGSGDGKSTFRSGKTGYLTAEQELEFDRKFKPKGAMLFFVLLVILGLIIWYGIYFLMLERI